MKNKLLLIPVLLLLGLVEMKGDVPTASQQDVSKGEQLSSLKIGYVNVGEVMAGLPATKEAEAEIKNYEQQLRNQLNQKVGAFKASLEALQKGHESMSEEQKNKKGKELKVLQERVEEFEQKSRQLLAEKQIEVTRPIFEQINAVIQRIAEEKNFSFIFNKGFNDDAPIILHGKKEYDLTSLVAAKLKKETTPIDMPVAIKAKGKLPLKGKGKK